MRNSLISHQVGDQWVEKVVEAQKKVSRYFKEHFLDCLEYKPTFDGVYSPQLS